ncbi:small nuclear RNA-activating protein [Trypanosoma equiperdum]|uniref:Small nuclear RNA-activating protein n=1 Tax=Trypanosoma equiperdum TaxID=5694 RepID=A0A1G4I1J2_TRYEQ|nr:small nuclear RNA-activating protein [Trypanosoma equiperdum]
MHRNNRTRCTIDDVNGMLARNAQLRNALQERYKQLKMRYEQLAALRAALSPSRGVTLRKLGVRQETADGAEEVRFLDDYTTGGVGNPPFRDAGIYSAKNIVCYAPVPPTRDELRWKGVTLAFPQLAYVHSLAMLPETANSFSKALQWSREEDSALREQVHAYKGARCGPSFWKALGAPGQSRFEVASHYIRLQQLGLIEPGKNDKTMMWIPEEQRDIALREAVWRHLGDEGGIMAAYVEIISVAARKCVYLSEVTCNESLVFPPYVWVKRTTFNWLTSLLIQKAKAPLVRCEGEFSDDTPLCMHFKSDISLKLSAEDMMACLLAFKGEVFGEVGGLRFIERAFLPKNRTYALKATDFMAKREGKKHKLDEEV